MEIAIGESFKYGEVWMTRRGTLYRVSGFKPAVPGKRLQVILRLGTDGSGRKILRDWDAVDGWVLRSRFWPDTVDR